MLTDGKGDFVYYTLDNGSLIDTNKWERKTVSDIYRVDL
jgi:hypothetical protein